MRLPAALIAAGTLAGTAVLMPFIGPAASTAPQHELPPECVSVAVHAYQTDGTFRTTWLEFCGNGPGGDSALHDWVQGDRFTLDGATAIGRGCGGSRANACVIFPGG